jgi:hypothetical protein
VSSESGSGDEASADGLRATAWKLVEDSWAVSRFSCSHPVCVCTPPAHSHKLLCFTILVKNITRTWAAGCTV